MDEILHINLENGQMYFDMQHFFPCTKSEMKKLHRIIREFSWQNDYEALHNKIVDYCELQIKEIEGLMPIYGRKAAAEYQLWKDAERTYHAGKWPVGVPLTKGEMESQKRMVSLHKTRYSSAMKLYKENERALKKFRENIKTLEEV